MNAKTQDSDKDDMVRSSLKDAAEGLKKSGSRLADETKDRTAAFARERQSATAEYLRSIALATDRGAQQLEEDGLANAANTASWAADRIEEVAERLRSRSPDELWGEVEDLARKRPALVFGAGFLLAFGGARFLKGSARRRHDDMPQGSDSGPQANT